MWMIEGEKIGGTPLYGVQSLRERYRATVLIKDETANGITHTSKDRRNMQLLEDDSDFGSPIYYVDMTYGNGGSSFGELCRRYDSGMVRRVINIVPEGISKKTMRMLKKYGPVVPVDHNGRPFEVHEMIEIGRSHVPMEHRPDAIVKTIESERNYRSLAEELYEEDFTHLCLPVGSFELGNSVVEHLNGKPVKIIGGTPVGSICASGERFVRDVKYSPADKLPCGYSRWQDSARKVFSQPGNVLYELTPEEVEKELEVLNNKYFQDVGPNSVAAYAALHKHFKRGLISPDDRLVILKTDRWKDHVKGLVGKRRRLFWPAVALSSLTAISLIGGYVHTQLEEKRQMEEQARQNLVSALKKGGDKAKYAIFGLEKGKNLRDASKIKLTIDWAYQDFIGRSAVREIPQLKKRWEEWEKWSKENLTEEERNSEVNKFLADGIVSRMKTPLDVSKFKFAYEETGELNERFVDIYYTLEGYERSPESIDHKVVAGDPEKMEIVNKYHKWNKLMKNPPNPAPR